MRAFLSVLAVLQLVPAAVGCGGGPAVQTSEAMPVRRVVLYRNGVGYFERSGRFEADQLTFEVRRGDVGDFLASLTAVDRAEGGGVRSASFEIDEPEEDEDRMPIIPLEAQRAGAGILIVPPEPPRPEVDEEDERVDVRLRLVGEDHDMTVSYVVASPIWRPTYRLVLDDEQGALLQAWAVVQNTSGEDWRDVSLSLTTGAPIAFESDLGTPIVPQRPRVTDRGEVVFSVPGAQTALAQSGADDDGEMVEEEARMAEGEAAMAPPAPAEPAPDMNAGPRGRTARAREQQAPTGGEAWAQMDASAAERTVTAAAAVAVLGDGVTRYDLDGPVTIPDGGSTMVAILSTRVPGEAAHLFAPDGGVPASRTHPFRVARLENTSGAMLERGPIAVLGDGEFMGQGVLDPLPRNATSFVPFAVDRSVVVEASTDAEALEGRLVRIERDRVIIERLTAWETTYHVRNGSDREIGIYIRHHRRSGADLHEPPEGVELTANAALVPATVPAEGEERVVVEERTPARRTVSFHTSEAIEAVALYLEGPAVDAAQGPKLRQALDLARELEQVRQELRAATAERSEVERSANETRQNLEAIRRVEGAADLRQRLVSRLRDLDQRVEELTRGVVELRTRESELRVRVEEALSEVSLTVDGEE